MQMKALDFYFFFQTLSMLLQTYLWDWKDFHIVYTFTLRSLWGKHRFCAGCSSTELPKARGPSTKVRGPMGPWAMGGWPYFDQLGEPEAQAYRYSTLLGAESGP